MQLTRYQQAIADFDQVIKLAPKHVDAYNSRGVARERLGKYDAAIADYDEVLKLNPKHEFAIKNRSRVMKARNAFAANQHNAEPLGFKLALSPLSAVQQKDDEMEETDTATGQAARNSNRKERLTVLTVPRALPIYSTTKTCWMPL